MMTKKKRLIHLSPGPVFKVREDRYRELSKYYTGEIVTSSPVPEIYERDEVCGFRFNCFKNNRNRVLLSNVRFFLYCLGFCLKKRARGEKYDFVTTYDPLKTGLFGVMVAALLQAKLIVEVNGVYTSPAEYLDDGDRISVKLKKICYPLVEKFVLSRASGIKTLFDGQLDPFEKVVAGKVVRSFPNLVEIDKFLQLEYREEKKILFVGFPFKRKGVDILIAAFKLIALRFPDWSLEILGWFPDPAELFDCMGGHSQINYHEPVPPDEVPAFIQSCAIFVLPSRSEAMGRVLIEAMAAGKPRVGARVDGIPTVINDGVDGLLFEPENVDDLARVLSLLIKKPALRRRLGAAGRRRAEVEMNKDVYFRNLVDFYERVLAL